MPIAHVLSILLLVGGLVVISALAKRLGIDRRSRWGRWRDDRDHSPAEASEVAALNALLARMEDRIATLERILDADDPKWRGRG